MRRLGILVTTVEKDPEWGTERTAFLEAMQSLGWMGGANLHINYRFAAGNKDRLAAASKELVALKKPDGLLARSTISVRALLAETRTIPVVFVSAADPLGEKFAASLARPGGNATGSTNVEATMGGKWLELLKEIAPHLDGSGSCSIHRWRSQEALSSVNLSKRQLRPSTSPWISSRFTRSRS